MVDVVLRANEGCLPDPYLLWDSRWFPTDGVADWRLAAGEPLNVGGLASQQGIETAAVLCLFTDLRCPASHPLAYLADGDPRGWWGDGVDVRDDLGEAPLGSLLWLLERAPMNVSGTPIARWAEQFARDALAVLIDQGAVVRVDASAVANEPMGRVELTIGLFGKDGTAVFQLRFDLLWRQVASIPRA